MGLGFSFGGASQANSESTVVVLARESNKTLGLHCLVGYTLTYRHSLTKKFGAHLCFRTWARASQFG